MDGRLLPRVKEALNILGIRNFLLGIHDTAFPGLPEEDFGSGSPYSQGAAHFLRFIRDLGFNGIQLGPQGITTPNNPSPYDGTLFSKNPLFLAPLPLGRERDNLLDPAVLNDLIAQRPPDASRVHREYTRMACQRIIFAVCQRYRQDIGAPGDTVSPALAEALASFRQRNSDWLERDAFYEILKSTYDNKGWNHWGETETARLDKQLFSPLPGNETATRMRIRFLYDRHGKEIEDYCFIQFLLARQHRTLRQSCRRLGLKLFGDCQIGPSERDTWGTQTFLLPDYLMGAPPSRTNPAGQPWNYPLMDPDRYFLDSENNSRQPGPAIRFFQRRIDKLFDEFDGLRIDHPHGLICPWVYRSDQDNPFAAVQNGARLFSSPDLADHPELARFAIVRPHQINQRIPRHDDNWVTDLASEQVQRYALLFEVIMESARNKKHGPREICCEILSTQPYPLQRVMDRYRQGRFRVTQKADLDNPADVYRSENARPSDWVMLGSHDTAPIWKVAEGWLETGDARRQAEYLADRLHIPVVERTSWVDKVSVDPGKLVQAKLADLFLGPARNVFIYFTDLFGMHEPYNRPGTISASNWSLRVPTDYRSDYREKSARLLALNIPAALALAVRAREPRLKGSHLQLIRELESSTSAIFS